MKVGCFKKSSECSLGEGFVLILVKTMSLSVSTNAVIVQLFDHVIVNLNIIL